MPVDCRGARRLIPKHVIKRAQEPVWQAPPPQREVLADERSLAFFHGKSHDDFRLPRSHHPNGVCG